MSRARRFKLIESSEQGMLAAVERAVRDKKPVVFLGWAPHPMNTHFDMRYLTGGDDTFGPNYGAAIVRTLTRKDYAKQCPNVGRLLANMEFNVALENEWMDEILSKHVRVTDLAEDWVAKRPEMMQHWLEGVNVRSIGRPALKALAAAGPAHAKSAFETWVTVAQDSGRRRNDAVRRIHQEKCARLLRRNLADA